MVPLLIALVSVSAILLAVAGVGIRERRRPRSLPRAFPCKLALGTGNDRQAAVHWPRGRSYGVWVHDVLLVYSGLRRTRVRPFHVHFADDMYSTSQRAVPGLGPAPVVIPVELDDGRRGLLATSRGSEDALAGPFLVAAFSRRLSSGTDH